MLAAKQTRQRLIARLHHDAVSHPLPELRLRCPKLLSIATDHERRLFLSLLFLRDYVWLCRHQCTLRPLRAELEDTQVPWEGSLVCEAAIKLSSHSQLALWDPQRV